MPETPRQRQVRLALDNLAFLASGNAAVREMDEVLAERAGEGIRSAQCSDCGHVFETRTKATGSKWSSLCRSCLQDQL